MNNLPATHAALSNTLPFRDWYIARHNPKSLTAHNVRKAIYFTLVESKHSEDPSGFLEALLVLTEVGEA